MKFIIHVFHPHGKLLVCTRCVGAIKARYTERIKLPVRIKWSSIQLNHRGITHKRKANRAIEKVKLSSTSS
jgi:hypothetical protein